MPVGEFISEIFFRGVVELIFIGLFYWTGFLFLKVVTGGTIHLAPPLKVGQKSDHKRKWHRGNWGIWHHRPMERKALKADYVCLVGILVWVIIGFGIYFLFSADKHAIEAKAIDIPVSRLLPLSSP